MAQIVWKQTNRRQGAHLGKARRHAMRSGMRIAWFGAT